MRIVLVDDHAPVRRGLKQLLEMRPDVEVVGEGSNGMEAVERVEELMPDIVLMDMNMPVMNGAEATKVIKERHPDIQVLALTAFGDMSLVSAMVKAGASGYLLKGGSAQELIDALQAVARGQGALDKGVTRGVIEDVVALHRKEKERAEELAQLDRMKSEFVAVVSHELRTPLTSIKGGVGTLQRCWNDIGEDEKLSFLESMSRQCNHLEHLVNQILTVSGIQRGGLGLKPSIFSLATIAKEAMNRIGDRAEGRQILLELTDVEASGDRERIRDVAVALIENALRFTKGPVTVKVGRKNGMSKLSVSDEGPGLDESTLRRLLETPFVQGDSSSTRAVGGLGLSLYIARHVLDASGGRFDVETSVDGGSCFTMALRPANF